MENKKNKVELDFNFTDRDVPYSLPMIQRSL